MAATGNNDLEDVQKNVHNRSRPRNMQGVKFSDDCRQKIRKCSRLDIFQYFGSSSRVGQRNGQFQKKEKAEETMSRIVDKNRNRKCIHSIKVSDNAKITVLDVQSESIIPMNNVMYKVSEENQWCQLDIVIPNPSQPPCINIDDCNNRVGFDFTTEMKQDISVK